MEQWDRERLQSLKFRKDTITLVARNDAHYLKASIDGLRTSVFDREQNESNRIHRSDSLGVKVVYRESSA